MYNLEDSWHSKCLLYCTFTLNVIHSCQAATLFTWWLFLFYLGYAPFWNLIKLYLKNTCTVHLNCNSQEDHLKRNLCMAKCFLATILSFSYLRLRSASVDTREWGSVVLQCLVIFTFAASRRCNNTARDLGGSGVRLMMGWVLKRSVI